ncbi:MAG: hypothetical protein QME65_03805 [Candidatus Omnitrophota bacterium]|nr:hypothetical protein [Candidatus Omnitrophota bacterium]
MKQKTLKRISGAVALLAALAFVIKFAGSAMLRLYIEFGVGNCRTIPIFCMAPEEKIIIPGPIDRDYIQRLIPYNFPKMTVSVPEDFSVTQERITKDYYKKKKPCYRDAAIYVLYEEPDFFINLFPQLKKRGLNNNYDFIKRTMYARIEKITNITDMFFIIMKGIFTPDLGDQRSVKMAQFRMSDRRGFINYNLSDQAKIASPPQPVAKAAKQAPRNDGYAPVNYFDCNVIKDSGEFFKIYIKDPGARLNLNWVLAIISTLDNI